MLRTLINISLMALLVLGLSVKEMSIEDQLVDFDVFKKVLIDKEGRLDLHTSEESILASIDSLENSLSTKKSYLEQYKSYTKMLAAIQCGHTQIHPNKEVFRNWLAERNALPFDYFMQGKKLYVNELLSEDDDFISENKSQKELKKKIKPNSEILEIDHKTVPMMMEEIGKYLSSDENAVDFKYFQASQLFGFYRHLSMPFDSDSIQVKYVTGQDTLEMYFQPGTAPVHTINQRMKEGSEEFDKNEIDIGSFKIHRNKYGYFRFNSFKACYGKKYEEFLERSFKKLKAKDIDKLIIDLRGNTGGVMQYSLMRYFVGEDVVLGRYVIEKPKKGIENKHIKKWNADYLKHRRMSRIQQRKLRKGVFNNGTVKTGPINEDLIFEGEIVVITDEGTFSSAAMLACHIKTLCDGKIIGRPAGGSFYQGNAGTLQVQLPHSKMKLFVNPNTFYSHLVPGEDPISIKQPDILLEPSFLKPRKVDTYYLRQAINAFK